MKKMKKYKTLEEFFADQGGDRLKQINALREALLEVEPTLVETLKWNAPNYVYKDEDRITFRMMGESDKVSVIIHMGAKKKEDKKAPPVISDTTGIVDWNSDIRGTITFDGMTEVKARTGDFKKVVKQWLLLKY